MGYAALVLSAHHHHEDDEELRRAHRRRLFFAFRVLVLLGILAGLLLFAWQDHRSRKARTDWSRSLDVAVIVIADKPLAPPVIEAIRARIPALEEQLRSERARHGAGPQRPFALRVFGPVTVDRGPPAAPSSDSLLEGASFAWELSRFASRADDAAGLGSAKYDSKIYVVARPPEDQKRKAVEGLSQQGGRVGVVQVELDETMVDFALFVVTHELFHTLGATDKYDQAGHPLVPDGLADPDQQPLFPQRRAELMARHRAVSEGKSNPPLSLGELAVGRKTAAEIGWLSP